MTKITGLSTEATKHLTDKPKYKGPGSDISASVKGCFYIPTSGLIGVTQKDFSTEQLKDEELVKVYGDIVDNFLKVDEITVGEDKNPQILYDRSKKFKKPKQKVINALDDYLVSEKYHEDDNFEESLFRIAPLKKTE